MNKVNLAEVAMHAKASRVAPHKLDMHPYPAAPKQGHNGGPALDESPCAAPKLLEELLVKALAARSAARQLEFDLARLHGQDGVDYADAAPLPCASLPNLQQVLQDLQTTLAMCNNALAKII